MSANRNRRLNNEVPKWMNYIGTHQGLTDYLDRKPNASPWVVGKFINTLLRGFGCILFSNSPISGALVITAIAIHTPAAAGAAVFTAILSLVVAVLLQQPISVIKTGHLMFNTALIGDVTFTLLPALYNVPVDAKIWVYMIIASVLCVYMNIAMGNILDRMRIPFLVIPFNMIQLMLFQCVIPRNEAAVTVASVGLENGNLTTAIPEVIPDGIMWDKVGTGFIYSMAQIFAQQNIASSVVLYLAVALYSPILCAFCFMGAVIGTCAGLLVAEPPYTMVYDGLWGYNAVVCAAAIGSVFYVVSWQSTVAAIFSAVFSVVLQHVLQLVFHPIHLPVLTVPFCICVVLFMAMTSTGYGFIPPSEANSPERNLYNFHCRKEVENNHMQENAVRMDLGDRTKENDVDKKLTPEDV